MTRIQWIRHIVYYWYVRHCLWQPGNQNPHDFLMASDISIIQYEIPCKFILLSAPSHIALPFQMRPNLFNTVVWERNVPINLSCGQLWDWVIARGICGENPYTHPGIHRHICVHVNKAWCKCTFLWWASYRLTDNAVHLLMTTICVRYVGSALIFQLVFLLCQSIHSLLFWPYY